MKKVKFILMALVAVIAFSSCERVAPNYAGVLYPAWLCAS